MVRLWLDLMIFKVFSNLSNSMIKLLRLPSADVCCPPCSGSSVLGLKLNFKKYTFKQMTFPRFLTRTDFTL